MFNKLRFWSHRKLKHLKFSLLPKTPRTILLIMGCQRSGTSMLMRTFDWHKQTAVFRELSEAFDDMRLLDDQKAFKIFDSSKAPLVVAKPLLDSQKFQHYLNLDKRVKILWPYRHYKTVAMSNIRKFGNNNGKRDLSFIVDNHPTDWRNELVSEEDRRLVAHYLKQDISDLDAAALFWYLRNKLVVNKPLDFSRFKCFKYESLTQNPQSMFKKIFTFIGFDQSSLDISEIHTNPKSKKKDFALHPEIEELCANVYAELEILATQSFPDSE
ncbi:MAG: sulfotransferase domain-containing protein [Gammaproteobacteria bacterium]|nr:sulfotransferase domain-containing protein [Gammaproteobacteria bacterium]